MFLPRSGSRISLPSLAPFIARLQARLQFAGSH